MEEKEERRKRERIEMREKATTEIIPVDTSK